MLYYMRVALKFEKLVGTDIELESQGYMAQKYGIVSAICLLSNYYNIYIYVWWLLTVPLEKHEKWNPESIRSV